MASVSFCVKPKRSARLDLWYGKQNAPKRRGGQVVEDDREATRKRPRGVKRGGVFGQFGRELGRPAPRKRSQESDEVVVAAKRVMTVERRGPTCKRKRCK